MKNRKEELVKVALEFVRKNGFSNFSYRDLSQSVGITKATIHHHFPQKEELGLAIINNIYQVSLEKAKDAEKLPSYFDRLNYWIDYLAAPISETEICPVSSLVIDLHNLPSKLQEHVITLVAAERQIFYSILQAGLETGEFHYKGETKALADFILFALKGAIQYQLVSQDDLLQEIKDQVSVMVKR